MKSTSRASCKWFSRMCSAWTIILASGRTPTAARATAPTSPPCARPPLASNLSHWNFFNAMPFGPHSDPTEAQLRWQIYTSLAHGARGVMYFCYHTPPGDEFPKGGAILTRDGQRTRHYDEARRINAVLKNLGPVLMKLTSTGVYRLTPKSDAADVLKGTPLKDITGDALSRDLLVGTFAHTDSRRAVLLNNYAFAYSAWPTVAFATDLAQVTEVDPSTGKELPVRDDSPDLPGLQLSLDAGQGRLFLVQRAWAGLGRGGKLRWKTHRNWTAPKGQDPRTGGAKAHWRD
jgi:hypothetical protein